MGGFERGKGAELISRLLEDSNFKMVEGKIVCVDTETLFNQGEHFRKKINKDIFS